MDSSSLQKSNRISMKEDRAGFIVIRKGDMVGVNMKLTDSQAKVNPR